MNLKALIATGFGIGRAPFAPGTAASLVAILIAAPLMALTGWIGVAVLAVVATAVGVWAGAGYSVETGIADPGDCVIDEFAGQWLACAVMGLAGSPEGLASAVVRLLLAFGLFRLFDIAKPWPVNRAEHLPGGFGIVADDVVAGAIAGFVTFLFADAGLI